MPARHRALIDEVPRVWKVSIRKICSALRVEHSLYTYKHKRSQQAALSLRIKEICETRVRVRYGYVASMSCCDVKAELRQDRQEITHSNQVWAMDFVHDQLATGKKRRILTIVDTHFRYSPATDPRFNNGSEFISKGLDL